MPEVPPKAIVFPTQWPKITCFLRRPADATDRDTRVIVYTTLDDESTDIGTLAADLGVAIAPLLDGLAGHSVAFSSRIPPRPKEPEHTGLNVPRSMHLPIEVVIYGNETSLSPVGYLLAQRNSLPMAPLDYDRTTKYVNPRPTSLTTRSLPSSGQVQTVTKTAEEIRDEVEKVFESFGNHDNLPTAEPCPEIITPMYPHQLQALFWIRVHEAEEDYSSPEFNTSIWRETSSQVGVKVYRNVITNQESSKKPPNPRGSVLADDMGLGKTICTIAAIVSTIKAAAKFAEQGLSSTSSTRNVRATLVIAPLSTVSNWEEQLNDHVQPNVVNYYVYHGSTRNGSHCNISNFDIVITTYQTLAFEYSRSQKAQKTDDNGNNDQSPLHKFKFFRVVLDEAHIVRESNTMQSRAVCALSAQRRLCLTGTPLQNRLDDMFALVKFLRVAPFQEKQIWNYFISAPIKSGDRFAISRLQLLVKSVFLRRSKYQKIDGKPIVDLPEKAEYIRYLTLQKPGENEMYQRTLQASHTIVDRATSSGPSTKLYINILQAILRLRQICTHAALVGQGGAAWKQQEELLLAGQRQEDAIDVDAVEPKEPLTQEQAQGMWELMKDGGDGRCLGCNTDLDDSFSTDEGVKQIGFFTPCGHLLCDKCAAQYTQALGNLIRENSVSCPLCQQDIIPHLFELKKGDKDAPRKRHTFTLEKDGDISPSTKLDALFTDLTDDAVNDDGTLKQRCVINKLNSDNNDNSVVFSQVLLVMLKTILNPISGLNCLI